MNLACQKWLGNCTKVLGIGVTPHPLLGKIPKKYRFFLEVPPYFAFYDRRILASVQKINFGCLGSFRFLHFYPGKDWNRSLLGGASVVFIGLSADSGFELGRQLTVTVARTQRAGRRRSSVTRVEKLKLGRSNEQAHCKHTLVKSMIIWIFGGKSSGRMLHKTLLKTSIPFSLCT